MEVMMLAAAGNVSTVAERVYQSACVNNQTETLLLFPNPAEMEDVLTALCNLSQSEVVEVAQDIRDSFDVYKFIDQVRILTFFRVPNMFGHVFSQL